MIKVLMVAGEAVPYVKTGGLADVVGSLAPELGRRGLDVRIILPGYRDIQAVRPEAGEIVAKITVPVGWRQQPGVVREIKHRDVTYYFLENEYYFHRPGLYGYYDDGERFAFFDRGVLEALAAIDFRPQVIHCHDWQTGMIPVLFDAYFRGRPAYQTIKTVFTIHNLKYQGVFPKEVLPDLLGLGWEYFTPDRVEYHDRVNFLKGGVVFADRITTVSPTYAAEIRDPYFGEGLDGLFRHRRAVLSGILNGLDYQEYNPASDPHIFANYQIRSRSRRRLNKVKLQELLGLPVGEEIPLIGVVSRLVESKGLDLIIRVLGEILAADCQMVVLGAGDYRYEAAFTAAARRWPAKLSVTLGFDEQLARRIYAGSDMFLMPSRFEPCGIGQLIALRYGSIPIGRETGGLRDTVQAYNEFTGQGTGFSFSNYNAHDLLYTVRRAVGFYHDQRVWSGLVRNAMQADFSWHNSAGLYQKLYKQLVSRSEL